MDQSHRRKLMFSRLEPQTEIQTILGIYRWHPPFKPTAHRTDVCLSFSHRLGNHLVSYSTGMSSFSFYLKAKSIYLLELHTCLEMHFRLKTLGRA